MDLDKLARELYETFYETKPKQARVNFYDEWTFLAHHVALMVLEARKDELEQRLELDDVAWNQWRKDLEARIKVIETEITKLKEG